MQPKFKKRLKIRLLVLLTLFLGFIAFVLNETKDEILADLNTIEGHLTNFHNPQKVAGFGAAVFTSDSVIYANGVGFADREKQIPYTRQTQQYLASISKTTIGIALLKAEEMGLLHLSDPINQHLPFAVINPYFPEAKITLQQLATHTSSLDYNEAVVESLYINEADKEASLTGFMIAYFADAKYGAVAFTEHLPGSNFNYSNIGSGLAAFIIEKTTGQDFATFTQTHIFDQLGLHNTSWFATTSDSLRHAQYYESSENDIQRVQPKGVILYPCRDLITDLDDMITYCQAIMARDTRLLKASSFEKLLSPKLDANVSNQYVDNNGLFFMIDRNQYGITYQLTGMNGGDHSINTMMWFDPVTDLGYIFIGNTGPAKLNRLNHIWIYRALVSLGDHVLMKDATSGEKIAYKWHNVYNRVRGLF